ncbi:hypothetical protein C1J05_02690 [Sulfitobacter sp. JL08]|nr:alanine:cation symporter family protein [Sulfitobacter sp. JL08]AXI53551.1 hypothetical protein C1J05_02690 [Sulfitobacter sp. JL08]
MQLTQNALDEHLGAIGTYVIAIAIIFFAFTSILGNYSYAENAMTFLGLEGKVGMTILRGACLGMVVWGAVQTVTTVFNFADAAMGLMAVINLIAILLLSGTVYRLTKDYFGQRRAGIEPTFDAKSFTGPTRGISQEIWAEKANAGKV